MLLGKEGFTLFVGPMVVMAAASMVKGGAHVWHAEPDLPSTCASLIFIFPFLSSTHIDVVATTISLCEHTYCFPNFFQKIYKKVGEA